MAQSSDLRKNLKILIDDDPYVVFEVNFVKPGKGTAFYKCRIRNLITGAVLDKTWRSSDKIDLADTEVRELEYIYQDDLHYVFMDTETYEQTRISGDLLDEDKYYLTDNLRVEVLFFNDKPVGIELPYFVELQVTKCEPGFKGDTAQGATKPATVSTGLEVDVPLFVEEGEWLKVDTRTGEYVERIQK
ncbi:MAG: elongation factor P [Deltaproteobacteria bacterium]|jgi:elongation factor P|nr:elongation factor P [Deltaproteobacteria bacterium]